MTATGVTVWFTGLPSSGKSTIANGLASRLLAEGRRVEVLDGDEIRRSLTADLGFSKADRIENVRRIGLVAMILARNGVTVLVPVIAPYEASRQQVRSLHAEQGIPFLEIHLTTPVDVCMKRDVKGLYAQHRRGMFAGLTGVDDPYEIPARPDLRIPAHRQTVAESISSVGELLAERGHPRRPMKAG